MKLLLSIFTVCLITTGAGAQKASVKSEVLFWSDSKPKTVELPLPDYPTDGGGLSGVIIVAIEVDENGRVSVGKSAGPSPICSAVTDPKVLALRRAASEAAAKAKFVPAAVDGKRQAAKGSVYYDFQVPSKTTDENADKFTVLEAGGDAESSSAELNGKALSLPKPAYPPAARAVRATGTVNIKVLIDESGNTYSAEAISGHPLLRAAAAQAACGAKFTPPMFDGKPVRITGIIVYNFVP